jgi:glycine/D-amino acid oxidase-like deaminating enzyme
MSDQAKDKTSSDAFNSARPRTDVRRKDVVVIGAGAVGVSVAYYLLTARDPPERVTIVEVDRVGGGSSGKCNGFLALDWHRPATTSMGELSWTLHADLAKEHAGAEKWGHRPMRSMSCSVHVTPEDNEVNESRSRSRASSSEVSSIRTDSEDDHLDGWLNSDCDTSPMSTSDSTAQV